MPQNEFPYYDYLKLHHFIFYLFYVLTFQNHFASASPNSFPILKIEAMILGTANHDISRKIPIKITSREYKFWELYICLH